MLCLSESRLDSIALVLAVAVGGNSEPDHSGSVMFGETMKGDVIPAVDPDDFKRVWEIRISVFGNLIDEEIYRGLCKPETDVRAADFRASFLLILTHAMPHRFVELMERGQLNDAFLSAFSCVPLVEGEHFNVGELLRQMETISKTPNGAEV